MRHLAKYGWAIAIVVMWVLLHMGQKAEQRYGVLQAERDSLRAENGAIAKTIDSLARAYARDTIILRERIRVVDTLTATVDHWKYDTLRVVEYVARTDTALRACERVVGTCESLQQTLRDSAANVVAQLVVERQLTNRPRTALGVAYDPQTQRWGGSVDRDYWRVRAGVTVIPDASGLRAGVRLSLWW